MRENKSQQVFDATASTYDRDRMKLIPGHDAFYRWAIDLIPANSRTIVDLGAGSGLLTILIRARFPAAHIHLIDFSAPMLDLARQRLGPDPNLTYLQADYLTHPFPAPLDAIVSSLSIHHLDDQPKRQLFAKCHASLRPGGVFINADHIAGPTPELEARYQATWLAHIRAAGATEQQITDSLFRQQEDRRASVPDQLAWLHAAGFSDADCWYKSNCFAVLAGTRS